jgi:hypothetical protein
MGWADRQMTPYTAIAMVPARIFALWPGVPSTYTRRWAMLFGQLLTADSSGSLSWQDWVVVAITALGAAIALTEIIVRLVTSPNRRNEQPEELGSLRTIRRWHPTQFSLARGQLKLFHTRLSEREYASGVVRGQVTEGDLYRWSIQQAIACAACIVPQSLGKANLFRVSQLQHDEYGQLVSVSLYSSEFVGVFSPNELIDQLDNRHIRSLRYKKGDTDPTTVPTALQCALEGTPVIHTLDKDSTLDRPERALGATHILGIPLALKSTAIKFKDQPVSITVELRYGSFRSFLITRRRDRHPLRVPVLRRARELAKELAEVDAFSDERMNTEPRGVTSAGGIPDPESPAEVPSESLIRRCGSTLEMLAKSLGLPL